MAHHTMQHTQPASSSSSGAFRRYLDARPRARRAALVLWCVVVIVGLAVGLSRAFETAGDEYDLAASRLSRAAALWQAEIAAQVSKATSLATAVAGFGVGDATGPIDHTANYSERIRFNNETHWQAFASNLVDAVPGIQAFEVQPSGIVAHIYPPNPDFVGFDLLTFRVTADGYREFIDGGRAVIVGPAELLGGGIGLVTRFPAYIGANKSFATFWGAGACVFEITAVLEGMQLAERVRTTGYQLLAYTDNKVRNPETTPPTNDVFRTTPGLTRNEACFSRNGLSARISIDSQNKSHALYICLTPDGGLPSKAPAAVDIVIIVAASLGVATCALLGLLIAAFAAFRLRHRLVPHRQSEVPADVCMALVAVKDFNWWQERQDQTVLAADLKRFENCVRKPANAHGCHVSGRISDGCVVVVSRSSDAIRSFGRAARRDLARTVGRVSIQRARHETESLAGPKSDPKSVKGPRRPSVATVDTASQRGSNREARSTSSGRHVGGANAGGKLFAVSCALHYGALTATYSASEDHFIFSGAGMTAAAIAVDATRAGELSFTGAFTDLLLEADPDSVPATPVVRALGDAADDADAAVLHVIEFDADAGSSDRAGADATTLSSGTDSSGNRHRRRAGGGATTGLVARKARGGGGGGNDSSVLTAVSAVNGAVLSKRVALVTLELLLPTDDTHAAHDAAKKFPATLVRIATATAALRGDVVSVHGTRVIVAFNALHTAAAPATKALHAVNELRAAAGDGTWVATATIGTVSVARTADSTLCTMCVGPCMPRAQALADLVARGARLELLEQKPSARCILSTLTVIDTAMARESKQSHELECLGSLSVAGLSLADLLPSVSAAASPVVTATPSPRFEQPKGETEQAAQSAAARPAVALVYAVHGGWNDEEDSAGDDDGEWLYRLRSRDSRSPFTALNNACEAFAEGRDSDAAAAVAAARSLSTDGDTKNAPSPRRQALSSYALAALDTIQAATSKLPVPLPHAPSSDAT